MKKNKFFFLSLLTIMLTFGGVGAFAQVQVPRDYQGTWVLRLEENGQIVEMILTFRTDTFSSFFNGEQVSTEIESWREITNEDLDTKNEYPFGGLCIYMQPLGDRKRVQMQIFLSRDKRRIILPGMAGSTMAEVIQYPFIKK
jgi:hypothetical protein